MPTGIEWCDETFNPWWGCAEVSPGCAHCYARTWANFTKAKLNLWPEHGEPSPEHGIMVTSDANWREPLKWARELPAELGRRPRVFCASMADVFEELPQLDEHRERLFDLIEQTPELDWLILTKRPEFARDWLYAHEPYMQTTSLPFITRDELPWGLPANVWLGVSIENARFTWRADVLREIPAAVRFISAEPLLGSLYPSQPEPPQGVGLGLRTPLNLEGISWIIVGGESGPRARPMSLAHAREIIRACACPGCLGDPHVDESLREAGRVPVPALGAGLQAPRRIRPTTPLMGFNHCATCDGTGHRPAVFVKQLGAKPVETNLGGAEAPCGRCGATPETGSSDDCPECLGIVGPANGSSVTLRLRDRKGGDWSEWPADLRIREFPRSAA